MDTSSFARGYPGSRSRRHDGLGVGLAITRAIVEQHGGTVTAASPGVGHGARVSIAWPPASPASGPAPELVDRRLEAVHVMVVDDDRDTRELLRHVLEEFGARVWTASSVQDALAAWDANPPQVLVSDISMPDQDGYSLVREIRRKPAHRGGHVPAIALTAFGRAEDRQAALTAGFQVHMRKPVDPFALVDAVSSLARGV